MNRRKRLWVLLSAFMGFFALVFGGSYVWLVAAPVQALRTIQNWSVDSVLGAPEMIEAPTGAMATWQAGHGDGATLVFVHGFGDAGAGWVQVADELRDAHKLMVVDLPGHGRSEPEKPPLTFEHLVLGLDAALNQVEGKVVLVGNSLGGWVSFVWAERHPERVKRLVLINSAGFKVSLDSGVLLPTTQKGMEEKIHAVAGEHGPDMPGFMLDAFIELHADPRLYGLFDECMTNVKHLDGRLTALPIPVTLVWGTPDPYFPKKGYLDNFLKERPEAKVHELSGCAHAPQYSCPERLVALLLGEGT